MKLHIEETETDTCINCPSYFCSNGMTRAYCHHENGPDRPLTHDEIWNGKFPKDCPLEDV